MVGVVFMRVNSMCAHQVPTTRSDQFVGTRRFKLFCPVLDDDNASALGGLIQAAGLLDRQEPLAVRRRRN